MDLRARLFTVIAVPGVVSTVLLGSATLIQVSRPGAFAIDPFFFLIGLTYGLSVLYLGMLRWTERHPWLADLQFGVDAMLVAAFIQVTGGITSYFSSLFVLPIIAASRIRFRRGAMQVAVLSAVLYLAIVAGQYVGGVPAWWSQQASVDLPALRLAQYTVAINLFGFLAVAWLSGSLAESLRSAGVRLADAAIHIADLRAYNQYVIDSLAGGLVTMDAECRVL